MQLRTGLQIVAPFKMKNFYNATCKKLVDRRLDCSTLEEEVSLNAEKAFGIQSHFIQPVSQINYAKQVLLITLLEGKAAEHVNSIREKAKVSTANYGAKFNKGSCSMMGQNVIILNEL